MPETEKPEKPPKKSLMAKVVTSLGFGSKDVKAAIDRTGFDYSETLTTTALTGNGVVGARNRQLIYAQYQQMIADPVVSGALRLHVTAALGGHETSGDVVFIEAKAEVKDDPAAQKLVKELNADLSAMFNRVAMAAAYNGAAFGDAFARLYTKKGKGITDLALDEMLLPPLVIPYEQGNKTVVCLVAIGEKLREKLVMDQIARVKMPRMVYTPQPLAVEKAWRMAVAEDDVDKLPLMPALVGGSFLADAELQFKNFQAALQGLVGQRVLDSIDESIFTAEVGGMTKEQAQEFLGSVKQMLAKSKKVADDAVKTGRPFLGRIRHILPVASNKQLLGIQGVNSGGGSGGGRAGNIAIDDVLFHAKLLCGSLGIDLSMLGFADLMSGGLGEGGFFRTSAQAAERSRMIRVALQEFYSHIIRVHLHHKSGTAYEPGQEPWTINFYGSISALESERVKTQLDSINAGMMLAQCFALVKDAGLDEAAMAHMFERVMKLDTEDSKMYAKAISAAKKEQDKKEAMQGGFGGPPGGDDGGGGFPPAANDDGGGEDDAPAGAPKPVPVGKKAAA